MPNKNAYFLKKLLATFKVEADEHLKAMSTALLELEKMPASERQTAIIEHVFREAHSLKGAARSVNMTEIESVCQVLESVFAALKKGQLTASQPLFDLLQEALDNLGGLLSSEGTAIDVTRKSVIATLIRRFNYTLKGMANTIEEPVPQVQEADSTTAPSPSDSAVEPNIILPPQPGNLSETVRVSTLKLGTLMRQTEEMLSLKLATWQRTMDVREVGAMLTAQKKQLATIQPLMRSFERSFNSISNVNKPEIPISSSHRFALSASGRERDSIKEDSSTGKKIAAGQQELIRLLEYVEAQNLFMKTLESHIMAMRKSVEQDSRILVGTVDSLLQSVREMLMLPFTQLLEVFPRFVRELARDQGKEIELVIQGGEIEIDRRILEEIKDPLIHLLRNCIDHGIEKPTIRREKQKSPGGIVTVAIAQKDSGKVEIVVTDDGAGVDIEKVHASARRLGFASTKNIDKLSQREMLALAFQSGVSTSPIITDISGRGLGLAIVREKIERLGGTIKIETLPDTGTTFRMIMPLTLASFRGLLVHAGDQLFVLPLHNVECAMRVAVKHILTVENRETIPLDGQAVSLVQLGDVLELPGKNTANNASDSIHVVILGLGLARIAFQVDEVLGEQEVLVKMLGRQLTRVRNVAGACVLGSGQVVPVLNVADLMKSAVRQTTKVRVALTDKSAETQQRSILVVEDSITSRALLKNILESAGYRVTTAVDGIDAYTVLKTATFDLVVSDVEMPRMNGLDLTAKVRSDKHLSELPIVLITALGSREHRERGIDVGANAYIVKGSFDQSNLLEVIGQLV